MTETDDKAKGEAVVEEAASEETEVEEAVVEDQGKTDQTGTKSRYHTEENMIRNGYSQLFRTSVQLNSHLYSTMLTITGPIFMWMIPLLPMLCTNVPTRSQTRMVIRWKCMSIMFLLQLFCSLT